MIMNLEVERNVKTKILSWLVDWYSPESDKVTEYHEMYLYANIGDTLHVHPTGKYTECLF